MPVARLPGVANQHPPPAPPQHQGGAQARRTASDDNDVEHAQPAAAKPSPEPPRYPLRLSVPLRNIVSSEIFGVSVREPAGFHRNHRRDGSRRKLFGARAWSINRRRLRPGEGPGVRATMTSMDVREFDFILPPELIAQDPAPERGGARLLRLDRASGHLSHAFITVLPNLLLPGDVIVVNNTRVFPARLLGRRVPSGGAVECLLIARVPPGSSSDAAAGSRPGGDSEEDWEALTHPGQKLKPGARVVFEGPVVLHAEILERRLFGRRFVRLCTEDGTPVERAVDLIGHVPLPPYIRRGDERADRERYQTVFAARRGSVAAPTAGLHFGEPLLRALGERAIEIAEITLHVGYGTFQPVRVERVEDHRLEQERYSIDRTAADAINRARDEGRRVIAVGTTTTRTLEAVARAHGGRIVEGAGATDLFIFPGFRFQVIERTADEFPPAAIVSVDARVGICRPGSGPGGVSRSHRRALSVL